LKEEHPGAEIWNNVHYDTLPKDDLIKKIEKQFLRKKNLDTMGENI
jgi:hypothetical protein